MTARVEIDTSREAAKEITDEVIRAIHGPDWVASKTDVNLTRHILLTVAAMMERQQSAAEAERDERAAESARLQQNNPNPTEPYGTGQQG